VILSLLSGGKSLPKRTSGEKPDMPPAIRYLLINLVGMLALLAGSFALYGAFETVNIASIASRLEDGQRSLLVQVAAFLLMGGFLVKSGVFPFHFGQPAFQIAAPIPISMIFAAAVLKIGVYGLLRLIALMFTAEAVLIQTLLLGLGAAGIAFGVWGAWRSQSAKGKLTHVSFGIIGVILIGIGVGTVQTLTGAIVLAVIHGIAVTALYALIGMPDSRYTMPTILIGTGALIAVLFTPLVEASVRAAVELAYPYLYVEPVIEAMQPAP
jgi:formate hydrogenlyase subunit 3/multisubunit Na+/H+ antiporter MnhD subunit